jgi:hypothetical protein
MNQGHIRHTSRRCRHNNTTVSVVGEHNQKGNAGKRYISCKDCNAFVQWAGSAASGASPGSSPAAGQQGNRLGSGGSADSAGERQRRAAAADRRMGGQQQAPKRRRTASSPSGSTTASAASGLYGSGSTFGGQGFSLGGKERDGDHDERETAAMSGTQQRVQLLASAPPFPDDETRRVQKMPTPSIRYVARPAGAEVGDADTRTADDVDDVDDGLLPCIEAVERPRDGVMITEALFFVPSAQRGCSTGVLPIVRVTGSARLVTAFVQAVADLGTFDARGDGRDVAVRHVVFCPTRGRAGTESAITDFRAFNTQHELDLASFFLYVTSPEETAAYRDKVGHIGSDALKAPLLFQLPEPERRIGFARFCVLEFCRGATLLSSVIPDIPVQQACTVPRFWMVDDKVRSIKVWGEGEGEDDDPISFTVAMHTVAELPDAEKFAAIGFAAAGKAQSRTDGRRATQRKFSVNADAVSTQAIQPVACDVWVYLRDCL